MHDRIPCPNGKTRYGFIWVLNSFSPPLSHRSGINSSGLTKLLSKRHATKFWVTVSVWRQSRNIMNSLFMLVKYLRPLEHCNRLRLTRYLSSCLHLLKQDSFVETPSTQPSHMRLCLRNLTHSIWKKNLVKYHKFPGTISVERAGFLLNDIKRSMLYKWSVKSK